MTDKTRKARLTLAALGVLMVGALIGGGVTAAAVLGGDDTEKDAGKAAPTASPSPSKSKALMYPDITPEKGSKVKLIEPTGQKGGASTGFPHTTDGAISAVVYFWEEYAFLDDQKARQQLEVVTSPDADGYIDEQISEVRKLRESVGLPPSGGTPAGVTFETSVNAARVRALTDPSGSLSRGDVVSVWLNYDRYATQADGAPDGDPLKDEMTQFIVKWQDGGWKFTDEAKYKDQADFPVSYKSDSAYAWQDGWWQVRHVD
ncbi:hypothetical protein ABT009_30515 [Streptomyces sp. NPDC002896]|uniref:hypothetical protein n=1 Tax=Streptomyces sp. NPDC002896 TaxID=3154438 RepID=UPI00332DF65F